MERYIGAGRLLLVLEKNFGHTGGADTLKQLVDIQPTADVVETEKYNELREAFVDFVCSGVHNPAPYCKNSCDECVDSRGFCTYNRCNGFNPDGRYKTQ